MLSEVEHLGSLTMSFEYMKLKITLSLMFLLTISASAQRIELVKDVNSTAGQSGSTWDHKPKAKLNGFFYFAGTDGLGTELWKTDGTAAGTLLVKDILPGKKSSTPRNFVLLNNLILFSAFTDEGYQIWKTDGTASGTVMIKNIFFRNTANSLGSASPGLLTVAGNYVYFMANNASLDRVLWRTDGTNAGTILLKDISTSGSSRVNQIEALNGSIYFTAYHPSFGIEMWTSDGTVAGTTLLKDINPGAGSAFGTGTNLITNINGTLYFSAGTSATGKEFWKSDGTASGTVIVKDLNNGYRSSNPVYFTEGGLNEIFFISNFNSSNDLWLWKSDGTNAGTDTVTQVNLRNGYLRSGKMIYTNNLLFFEGHSSTEGTELWKSDGTFAGTEIVKDINSGTDPSFPILYEGVNNVLYFMANDNIHGQEVWKSDGTSTGTVLVKDIRNGISSGVALYAGGSILFNYFIKNNEMIFNANDGNVGTELWKTDGSNAGTALIKDIYTNEVDNKPDHIIQLFNGKMYYILNNNELWSSDGTTTGTVLVKKLTNSLGFTSSISNLVASSRLLFFSYNNGANGSELWKSDGTNAGTVMVKDINPGSGSANPSLLTLVNDTVFFIASEVTFSKALFKSDGTSMGTVKVDNIIPSKMAALDNQLYFSANVGTSGTELYKTTNTGTALVKDIEPSFYGSSYPNNFTVYDGKLYFSASTNASGSELWVTDGTSAGTIMVKEIYAGFFGANPKSLTVANSSLYFTAQEASNGRELWKTDGTNAGTVLVKDINSGVSSSNPINLTSYENKLLFFSDNGVNGNEPWLSDGTGIGTIMVKDIHTSNSSSTAIHGPSLSSYGNEDSKITVRGNLAYFAADNGTNGMELWQTNGTAAGTKLVEDYNNFKNLIYNACPENFVLLKNKLYFFLDNGKLGSELHRLITCTKSNAIALGSGIKKAGLVENIPGSTQLCFCGSSDSLLLLVDTIGSGAVFTADSVSISIGVSKTTSWTTAGGIITNSTGGAIINRLWNINPSKQPDMGKTVKVALPFTQTEFRAIKDTLANHNGGVVGYPTTISTPEDLEVFKVEKPKDAFVSPHADGVSGHILSHNSSTSTTNWSYSSLNSIHHLATFEVNSFSGGGIGGGGNFLALPISLLNFEVKAITTKNIAISWKTSSEINNSHFELERSYDGTLFEKIAIVQGNGNSQSINSYQLEDTRFNPASIYVYYRLRQVDYNGNITTSEIRSVYLNNPVTSHFKVFPNPSNGVINISTNLGYLKSPKHIEVYNLNGMRVYEHQFDKPQLTFSLSHLSKGTYLLVVSSGNTQKSTHIMLD